MSNPKLHYQLRRASGPLFKHSHEVHAETGCECLNRTTSSPSARIVADYRPYPATTDTRGEHEMAWSKVTDIAYGRLRSPDLDVQEEFLTRFGMHRVERTANALYMRGTYPAHHTHITEKGDPKFVGIAYYVNNEDDLKKLSKAPGASGVEHMDEPGGGKRVRLTEPNGYQIEVVAGIAPVEPIKVMRQKLNSGEAPTARAGELMRLPKGPAHVKRIGHGVMMSSKFHETVGWFRETL